jgi:hypothetical protein
MFPIFVYYFCWETTPLGWGNTSSQIKTSQHPHTDREDSFVCQTIPNPAVRHKYLSATATTTYQISNNEM